MKVFEFYIENMPLTLVIKELIDIKTIAIKAPGHKDVAADLAG